MKDETIDMVEMVVKLRELYPDGEPTVEEAIKQISMGTEVGIGLGVVYNIDEFEEVLRIVFKDLSEPFHDPAVVMGVTRLVVDVYKALNTEPYIGDRKAILMAIKEGLMDEGIYTTFEDDKGDVLNG